MRLENCKIRRGSVMVLGRISLAGVGPIVHGNINASVYKNTSTPACSSSFTQRDSSNSNIYARQPKTVLSQT